MVDFSGIHKTIQEVGVFSIPKLVFLTSHKPVFNLGAVFYDRNRIPGIGSRDDRCNDGSLYGSTWT